MLWRDSKARHTEQKNPKQRRHVGEILNVPYSCFIRYLSNSFQGKVCNTSACCALWPISNYSSRPSSMEREKRQYAVKSKVLCCRLVNSVSLLDAKCSRIKKANVLFSHLMSGSILSWTIFLGIYDINLRESISDL